VRFPCYVVSYDHGGLVLWGYEHFLQHLRDTLGWLERHPKLTFILGESATGWIPFVVQEMDFRYKRLFERQSPEQVALKELPSDIFKRQVWATYQADYVGLHLVDFFGDGHMMWASDYPHGDSTWPHSLEAIASSGLGGLDDESRSLILWKNAAALYRITGDSMVGGMA